MKFALNAVAVLTFPVWWPTMVAIECVQIACGVQLQNLLGPRIYQNLTPS
jgi:hypothetical protein